jgi:hypothetical protein
MPVKVNFDGNEVWLNIIEKADSSFVLTTASGREIAFDTPLKLDSAFKDKDFEIFFLSKKNVKESDICQIYHRKTDCRIGWVIPAISLASDLHDFATNEHFLRYSYIAIREALDRLDEKVYSKCLSGDSETVLFTDLFHEETVFLVLSKETYGDDFVFDFHRASPSLIKNGYVKLTNRNPDEIRHEVLQLKREKKVYLEEVSVDLKTSILISDLFNFSFSYESKAVFKFFYLYQIFELLIDEVYQNEQDSLVKDLIDARGDSGKTKDTLDKMRDFIPEKNRIRLLVNNYIDSGCDFSGLKIACNKLLTSLGRDESNDFEGYFYRIRNFIFHQYRDFPDSCVELLDDVVEELVLLIPCILSKYQLSRKFKS